MAKSYFEATITGNVGFPTFAVDQAVGIAPAGVAFGTISNGTIGPFANGAFLLYMWSAGTVLPTAKLNNANQFTFSVSGSGLVVRWAVDDVAKLAWVTFGAGNWNANPTASPATGAGGVDISGLTFPVYPTVVSANNTNFNVVFNFGATAFAYAVPAGFLPGWASTNGTHTTLSATDNQAATLSNGGLTFQSTISGGLESGARASDAAVWPEVPINLHATGETNTTISVAWTAGSGAAPTSYTLQYRVNGTAPWTLIPGIAGLTQTVSGLLPGGYYDFQVEAFAGSNPSGFSNTITVQTIPLTQPVPAPPATLGKYRGQVGINWKGRVLVGDAFSGMVGLADFQAFTEYGNPMEGLITSPPVHSDRLRIVVNSMEIDVETGVGLTSGQGENPAWMLDWSKDGGRTWSATQLWRSMGRVGKYLTRLRWVNLGQARQWVFRLRSTDPVRRVIIGTYLDTKKGIR